MFSQVTAPILNFLAKYLKKKRKRNEGQLKTFAQYYMQFSNLDVWGRKSSWLQIVMQSGCKVDSVAVFKQSLNVFSTLSFTQLSPALQK